MNDARSGPDAGAPDAGAPDAGDRSALLHQALKQAYNAVVITDARFDHGGPLIAYVNPAFCAMTGYPADELLGRSPRLLQGPATDRAVIDRLRACLHEARFFEGETVNYRKDGTPYRVRWNVSPVRDGDGAVTHFVSVQRETTAEADLQAQRALLARALDGAVEAIAVLDDQARFVFVNEAWTRLTGVPRAAHEGRSWAALDSDEDDVARDWNELLDDPEGVRRFATIRRPDGSARLVDRSVAPIDDPVAGPHYVVVAKDVTDRLQRVESLLERAEHDALTGALTRGAGERELAFAVERSSFAGEPLAVLLVDVDRFKRINDTLGHAAGDRVLATVARVLHAGLRGGDAVVRWGGEEFLVVLPGLDAAAAARVAERMRAELAAHVDPGSPPVTASFGVAVRRRGEAAEALVARADRALYAAKHGGRDAVRVADD